MRLPIVALLLAGTLAHAETPSYLVHEAVPVAGIVEVHSGSGTILGTDSLLGAGHTTLTVEFPDGAGDLGLVDWPYVILDFGRELSGAVVFASSSPVLVETSTGESLEELERSPWITDRKISSDSLEPGTENTGFRYAKITFEALPGSWPSTIEFSTLRADFVHYPVTYRGSFESSDLRLNQIWQTGAYAAELCMQDEIWDAPKRDRRAWMGDLHVSGEVINTVFADRFLMEKTLADLRRDAQGDHAASDAPDTHVNEIPGYSCAWIAGLADFHRHQGDLAFLESQKPMLLSLLAYLKTELDERGVFANRLGQWNFVDWSPGLDDDSLDARRATHFFMAYAANEAAFLLQDLGEKAEAKKTETWAEELRQAARTYLLDPVTGTYGSLRQVNAMAILAGIPTPEQRAQIAKKIFTPASEAWNQVASPYYDYYVLRALGELGNVGQALDFVRSYWGGMLDLGATTFWEAYDPSWPKTDFHSHLQADDDTGTMVSLSHGWSSGPTAWLTETILGVRPTARGFDHVNIEPELGDLAWAQGVIPTPHGELRIRVERNGANRYARVTLPAGILANVALRGPRGTTLRVLSGAGEFDIASP